MNARHLLRHLRRVRYALLGLIAIALLLQLGAAPLAAQKPPKVMDIDCADGDSINRAVSRRYRELIINIKGICVEDVVVARDRVTLRGTDPAVDGIQAASTDDPYGAALFIRGGREVTVENLQLTGGRHAGLAIEDVRRSTILRNLRIEGNKEVGLQASNSLVMGFDLSITGNGLAGVGISETAYFRCQDCTIADNPAAGQGFGVLASAGAMMTLTRGSVSAEFPLSFRFNSVADVNGTTVSGYLAIHATGNANFKVRNATIDGSILADDHSLIDLRGSQQVFNPAPGGNVITGDSQMTVTAGTMLIGDTVFDEFSNGIFSRRASLEELVCSTNSDAACTADVSKSSSTCASCP